jgi:type VI secretion system protein VasG
MAYDGRLIDAIAARCTEVESGARNVDNILTNTLLPELSRMILEQIALGRKLAAISVGVADDGGFAYDVQAAAYTEAAVTPPVSALADLPASPTATSRRTQDLPAHP